MTYLMIESKGEAPIESYTMLGASLSRENSKLIGQFGSGSKLAICTLLRKGLGVTIFSGRTRMQFLTKDIVIKDEINSKVESQVFVQFAGTSRRKQDLAWTLGFGQMDWQDEDMACREFISNAIDHTVVQGLDVNEAYANGDLGIKIVGMNDVRARAGYTRVYIDVNEKVEKYVLNVAQRFLHFSDVDLSKNILPKLCSSRPKAQIYYNGVFVRELNDHRDSIADYNFTGTQIKIDESRNLEAWTAASAVAKLYKRASAEDLTDLFQSLKDGVKSFESGLSAGSLECDSWDSDKAEMREQWKTAWEAVHGDKVCCSADSRLIADFAIRKGHQVAFIDQENILTAMKSHGIPMVLDVVDSNERNGRTVTEATKEAQTAVREVWEWIKATSLIPMTKECPKVMGFDELMNAGSECLGFYTHGGDTVHIRNDLGGQQLKEVCLHEIGHFVTQAEDNSRDFQEFFIRLLVRWLA